MVDNCTNCGTKITDGGIFGAPNERISLQNVKLINFIHKSAHVELCQKCGAEIVNDTLNNLKFQAETCRNYISENIVDFPMMTIGQVPPGAKYRIKGLVTANVTVGTGLFNEMSQGFSDMFGATTTNSGMALKINSGEATARRIVASKAITIGANCVIGVDIDYGLTTHNAATVNMQGTAVSISNLHEILDEPEFLMAKKIEEANIRAQELSRWLQGEF